VFEQSELTFDWHAASAGIHPEECVRTQRAHSSLSKNLCIDHVRERYSWLAISSH